MPEPYAYRQPEQHVMRRNISTLALLAVLIAVFIAIALVR